MAELQTFIEAEQVLQAYIPVVKEITGKDITLQRMEPLMERLGNPQNKLRVVHVAGTSGKTSTAYYIASLLSASGKKVGLTISPHIGVVSERIQINLQPLSERDFCKALDEFLQLIADVDPKPSYFELLMAMAYWYFHKIGADYAVIETGFGGLHDASNISHNPDKICVLTDIGFDHMHILGNTLEAISYQKAGIMHNGNNAYCFRQDDTVIATFEAYANKVNAQLHVLDEPNESDARTTELLRSLPLFQQRNWKLAYCVYEAIAARDGLPALSPEQLRSSMETVVPGRMEHLTYEGKTVVLDGAHNEQKMQAFVRSFEREYPGRKVPILLGMKAGKEYKAVLPLLLPITRSLILTAFHKAQDLPAIPLNPALLAEEAKNLGFANITIAKNVDDGLRLLLDETQDLHIITGSFYLLAEARKRILEA